MYRYTVCLCVLFLSGISAQSPDLNKVIMQFIQTLDGYIQKQNMSEIKLMPISKDFGIVNVALQGGYVKNLSSIQLIDNSVSLKNDSSGKTISFQIGFQTLQLHFGMVQLNSLLLNIDDDITVTARSNSLAIGLKLAQKDNKCQISVVQASTNLGDFDVTLKDATDLKSSFFDDVIGYFVEKVLNLFSSKVESFLNPQLQKTLNTAISSMDLAQLNLCQLV